MNGYCDKCGRLIINDACVYELENGKIVGMLCLDCDEEGLKNGNEQPETIDQTEPDPEEGG